VNRRTLVILVFLIASFGAGFFVRRQTHTQRIIWGPEKSYEYSAAQLSLEDTAKIPPAFSRGLILGENVRITLAEDVIDPENSSWRIATVAFATPQEPTELIRDYKNLLPNIGWEMQTQITSPANTIRALRRNTQLFIIAKKDGDKTLATISYQYLSR
jgi:hypothetical protein